MKKNLILIFLIVPFLEPLCFKESIIDEIYSAYKIISFVIIVCIYTVFIAKKNSWKFSKYTIIIIIYQLSLYISTFINKGNYSAMIGNTISVLSLAMIVEIYAKGDNFRKILKIFNNILTTYTIINLLSVLIGSSNNNIYFLGIDNRFIFFLLPNCFITILIDLIDYDKITIKSYIIIALALFQCVYVWAVSAVLSLVLLLLYAALLYNWKIFKKMTLNKYLIIIMVMNLLLVFFQIQNYFEYFIVDILHKDLMLSGRVYTWNAALEIIKEHPIFGIGGTSYTQKSTLFYRSDGHAHNLILNILVNGGIVSLIIMIFSFLKINNNLKSINNKKISGFISFAIFNILFLSLTDTLDSATIYLVYLCGYYISEVYRRDNICKEKN